MNLQTLIDTLYPPGGDIQLTDEQREILNHPNGPAWVLAGPGSGKTEVLTLLVLRLLFVDNDPVQQERVPPESILVTTFTKKAAKNLEDRIEFRRRLLVQADPSLADVDVTSLRIGTLHGLCNDLLQEFRASNYQNVRPMDEFEQALFVREHMSLIKQRDNATEIAFWSDFDFLFRNNQWQRTWNNPPNRWNGTKALVTLLDRVIEDRVSLAGLRAAGGQLARLADLAEEYESHLQNNYRCDFTRMQHRFLEFLQTPLGQNFRDGDGASYEGIKWVLVDEYQDTNPMQEEIYFTLCQGTNQNLVVVGDDDQAMYRFRGGSVECMVTFDEACESYLGIDRTTVGQYPLVGNFRSHSLIVDFFNNYITSFPVMNLPGARAPKPEIESKKTYPTGYPAIGRIQERNLDLVAETFARTVRGLVDRGVVNDPSECCLLLKSTRDSPMNAGKYVAALERQQLSDGSYISVYNPRNKSFMQQEEVQTFLGAILAIVDPSRRYATDPANTNFIPNAEPDLRNAFAMHAAQNPELQQFVSECTAEIAGKPGEYFEANLQEIGYYLLSKQPFAGWLGQHETRIRLAKLTKLLEAYSSTPVLDPSTGLPRANVSRGSLKASTHNPGEVISAWLMSFYNLFIGYVTETGFDDDEIDDEICPQGSVAVMTMHQSKGLEFPFVFVGHLGENPEIQGSHRLESILSQYPANPSRVFTRPSEAERAEMDLIRQYYVAYSRAKYGLIMLGSASQINAQKVPCGPFRGWLAQNTQRL